MFDAKTRRVLLAVTLAVLALMAVLVACDKKEDEVVTMGVTNFSSVTLSDDLVVGDDATVSDDLTVSGDASVAGNLLSSGTVVTLTDGVLIDGLSDQVQLQVQGYTTQTSNLFVLEQSDGTDVLTADNNGNVSASGAVTVSDYGLFDGDADEVQLTVQGHTTQTSKAFVVEQSDGTDKFTVDDNGDVDANAMRLDSTLATTSTASIGSYLYHRTEVITKSVSYTLTAAESGSLFSNHNASGEITFTLPAAAEGLSYCIYVHEAYTVNLDAASGDQVHHLTDSAGDRVQNSGTAGDSVCVSAMNVDYWVPTNEEGTWADAN